jgi:hypothetical protein
MRRHTDDVSRTAVLERSRSVGGACSQPRLNTELHFTGFSGRKPGYASGPIKKRLPEKSSHPEKYSHPLLLSTNVAVGSA